MSTVVVAIIACCVLAMLALLTSLALWHALRSQPSAHLRLDCAKCRRAAPYWPPGFIAAFRRLTSLLETLHVPAYAFVHRRKFVLFPDDYAICAYIGATCTDDRDNYQYWYSYDKSPLMYRCAIIDGKVEVTINGWAPDSLMVSPRDFRRAMPEMNREQHTAVSGAIVHSLIAIRKTFGESVDVRFDFAWSNIDGFYHVKPVTTPRDRALTV